MYSNNILNLQESTTILNACSKKYGNLLNELRIYLSIYLSIYVGNLKVLNLTQKEKPQLNIFDVATLSLHLKLEKF